MSILDTVPNCTDNLTQRLRIFKIDVDEDTFEKITEVLLAYNTTCNDIAKALNINKLLENCNFILKGKLKNLIFHK